MSSDQTRPPKTELVRYYEEGKANLRENDPKKAARTFTKAIRAYDEAIDTREDLAVVYCARSGAQFHQKKFEDSLMDAAETVRLRPTWSKVYFIMG